MGLIVFAASILLIGLLLLSGKQFRGGCETDKAARTTPLVKALFFLVVFITASNVVTTFLECGLGQCPGNPVSYLELNK